MYRSLSSGTMGPDGGILVKKETFLLSNLNCPTCAGELQKALAKIGGVRRAQVTFATGVLELEYDERVTNPADIEQTVKSFGAAIAGRM